jgi:hypothetical protein
VHVVLIGFPRCCTLLSSVIFDRVRLDPTGFPRCTLPQNPGCRKSIPSEATSALPGAEGETTTGRRFHSVDDGRPEPSVRVARCAGDCEAGHPIPLNERHLKMTIKEWGLHYNRGRPQSSLGPGIPEPKQDRVPASNHRYKLPAGYCVVKTAVLGGLHHEYRLVKEAA